ncbi:MAG TPA: hypothetical protein ENL09_04485, partial [Bacteroidetes bacterium]|nr:hypothetical protein [Bacteroidota bacterium]
MELKTINIYLNTENSYLPKVKYVFNTICNIMGVKAKFFSGLTSEVIHIYYGIRTEDDYPIFIYHNPEAVDFF